MIIINQEGKRFNFDNMLHYQAVEFEDVGEVVCKMINNESWVLGTYDSFERAEEVVKELDNCYYNEKFYSSNQTFERVIALNTAPKIFRMPEE